MRNYKFVILCAVVLPLLALSFMGKPSAPVSAFAVTNTPTSVPPTDTPVPPPATDTPAPPPATDTPVAGTSVPTNTPVNTPVSGSTPNTPPNSTPVGETSPEDAPVETPSVIPALGGGPRPSSVMFFGIVLMLSFGLVSMGWLKVWQAYRHDN